MPLLTVAVLVAAVGGLWYLDRVASTVVRPRPRPAQRRVGEAAAHREEVRIPSDGQELGGWLLRPREDRGRALALLVHGWGLSHGVLVGLAERLLERGHPVLLFDVRGHGGNEPVPYATIRHFRDDIGAAVEWAAARDPERRRVLVGYSMGGAGSVLAAAEGAPVHGLVLLATPADVLEATADYLDAKGMPGRLLVWVLRPFWWPRVGGTFRPLTPWRRLAEVEAPVLVVHPERDERVPLEAARRLTASGRPGGVRLEVVEGAGHADILEDPRAHRAVLSFLEEAA